ncbi:MAG: 30S ribosome-binding factor RbfA [Holosporaceae bacterium]|jgi:ribosome-binding factor A|nr:30S ribosome-binding factor RbfA [Holosporaceae bacterium]
MKKPGNIRPIRVAFEIKRVLSEFLLRKSPTDCNSNEPELISVTDVVVTPCLRHAKIYVVCPSDSDVDCAEFLNRHIPRFRHCIGAKIRLKFVPKLEFIKDNSYAMARRIQNLIKT